MSSTQRGFAQPLTKSFSAAVAAKAFTVALIEAALPAGYTKVSDTVYTVATTANLISFSAALEDDGTNSIAVGETVRDMGKSITVSALDTGATIRFALVQRSNAVEGSSGKTAYVPVYNSIAQSTGATSDLKVTVFRSG
jgi:hypothetical protein